MKRINCILLALLVVFLFNSCKNEKKDEKNGAVAEAVKVEPVEPNTVTPKYEEDLSGNLIVITEEEFSEKIMDINNPKGFQYKGRTPCIVDFYADWCRPCSFLNPVLISLAKEYQSKIIIYKINADKAQIVCNAIGIANLPTLLFLKSNSMPTIVEGFVPEEELRSIIDELLLSDK